MVTADMYLRKLLFAILALPAAGPAIRQDFFGIWGTGIAFLLAFSMGETMEGTLLSMGVAFQEAALMAVLFPALLFWRLQSFIRGSLLAGDGLRKERCALLGALSACAVSACMTGVFWRMPVEKGWYGHVAAFFICSFLCMAAFLVCGLFRKLSLYERESLRMGKLIREEEYRQRQKQEILAVSGEVRKLRHDMKNSCQLLYGLLEQGRVEKAMDYLRRQTKHLPDIPLTIYTGSEAVNTLLNLKQAQGREQEILFTTKVTTELAGISEYDVCCLLGNLLDNAIEAACQCKEGERRVDFRLGGDRRKCLIEVSNSVAGAVLENGRLPVTTKEDACNHGLGYLSMADIVEKYNGSMKFSEKEGEFLAALILFRKI